MRASTCGFALALAAVAIGVPLLACHKSSRLTAAGCTALTNSARESVTRVVDQSNARCNSDPDCVEVEAIACVPNCGGFAVHQASSTTVKDAVRRANDSCKRWQAADCESITPLPMMSCPHYVPRCVDSKCVMKAYFPEQ